MSASTNYPTIRPSLLLDFANTEQLDPRISFARSTTATYYDDNTVAKAEENLFTYSQDFDNAAWTKWTSSVTANATTAPDGTSTADLLYPSASGAASYVTEGYVTSGSAATFSVYAKAQNKSIVWLYSYSGAAYGGYYLNLSSGATQVVSGSTLTGTITATNIGSGWYRLSVTFSSTYNSGTVLFGIGVADAMGSSSVTASGTDGIYIWGAQLEQRAAVTAYTATTSATITNYIPVLLTAAINEARLDHNPTTRESLGLLIEESRTNLLTYSDDFVTTWTSVGGGSISSNVAISPFGIQNADALVPDSVNGVIVNQAASTTTTAHTFSVFAKANGVNTITLASRDNPNANLASFDLSTGVATLISGTSCSMVNCGDGWWRCITTFTPTVAASNRYRISTPAGNGFSSVFIWGAQLEAGAFPTSYIPTVASQVTRSADSASMTGSNFSSWYSMGQGAAYIEGSGAYCFEVHQGSANVYTNYWIVGDISTTGVDRYIAGMANNVTQWESRVYSTKALKMSFAYAVNDIAGYYNGVQQFTDTVATIPSNVDTAYISYARTGWVKRIAYYPARLTNAQLQALTS